MVANNLKAILHIDGDAFFVGVEMAKNPKLKGKLVVTGEEKVILPIKKSRSARDFCLTKCLYFCKIGVEKVNLILLNMEMKWFYVRNTWSPPSRLGVLSDVFCETDESLLQNEEFLKICNTFCGTPEEHSIEELRGEERIDRSDLVKKLFEQERKKRAQLN